MLNHITIMGRLTAEPELRTTNSGVSVASFTVACERDFAQGGQKETDFVSCVAWRQTGEFVSRYFNKGSMIVVSGRLQSRKWEDRDVNKRIAWEINADRCYFGESRRQEDTRAADSRPYGEYGGPSGRGEYGGRQVAAPTDYRTAGAPVDVDRPQGFDGFREMEPGTGEGNPFAGGYQDRDLSGGKLPF